MEYRREVDGLRAVAVIPVILFHAGIGAFQGGFVGVDVFFVISGYLITSILLKELEAGKFSILNFYERRARRILPALTLVMLTCIPFVVAWLPPPDVKGFAQSLVAVWTFSSNILFWRSSGYFDPAAELKPLLHTWSLAVEEQYYLIFPVLLLLTWRCGKHRLALVLAGIALISLAGAQWAAYHTPTAAFYLLHTRAWELLIGALVAFYFSTRPSFQLTPVLAQGASLLGLMLIVYAVFAFDKRLPFPGFFALVPTVGAALILLFARPDNLVGKMLGARVCVGVGLLSYSAYLWHQPMFALARLHRPDTFSSGALLGLLPLLGLLSFLTWRYVEGPFRSRKRFSRRQIFGCTAACGALFVGMGVLGHLNWGFTKLLSPQERTILAYQKYDRSASFREGRCFLEGEQTYTDFATECRTPGGDGETWVVWGDSYAASLSSGVRRVHPNTLQYTASSCPPVISSMSLPECVDINRFVQNEIARLRPAVVLLVANWHTYQDGHLDTALVRTINVIRTKSPDTRISVVGGFPQWFPVLPVVLVQQGVNMDHERQLVMTSHKIVAAVDETLRGVAARTDVAFLPALPKFCAGDKCLVVIKSGDGYTVPTWDNGHLTAAGADFLAARLFPRTTVPGQAGGI